MASVDPANIRTVIEFIRNNLASRPSWPGVVEWFNERHFLINRDTISRKWINGDIDSQKLFELVNAARLPLRFWLDKRYADLLSKESFYIEEEDWQLVWFDMRMFCRRLKEKYRYNTHALQVFNILPSTFSKYLDKEDGAGRITLIPERRLLKGMIALIESENMDWWHFIHDDNECYPNPEYFWKVADDCLPETIRHDSKERARLFRDEFCRHMADVDSDSIPDFLGKAETMIKMLKKHYC